MYIIFLDLRIIVVFVNILKFIGMFLVWIPIESNFLFIFFILFLQNGL